MKIKTLLRFLLLIAVALALYFLLWPVPITPAAWTPPQAPELAGPYAQNSLLAGVKRLDSGGAFAPEDVALDAQGRIYGGADDGRIMRLNPDGTHAVLFANTGGRPVGPVFRHESKPIVADAHKRFLSIAPNRSR